MTEFSQDTITKFNQSLEQRGSSHRIAKIISSGSHTYNMTVSFTNGTDLHIAATDPVEAGKKLSRFVRLGKL